jgi:hypothetical protein
MGRNKNGLYLMIGRTNKPISHWPILTQEGGLGRQVGPNADALPFLLLIAIIIFRANV